MSTDYYSRLERERGPHPSEQMIASIAQGLHLSLDERDHLFRLAGHRPPPRGATSDHISPGLLRVLDRLVGEMWDLDALPADCDGDGVYGFWLRAGPLPVTGAVGSPVNPIAVK